jgi:hypothetical protein
MTADLTMFNCTLFFCCKKTVDYLLVKMFINITGNIVVNRTDKDCLGGAEYRKDRYACHYPNKNTGKNIYIGSN